MRCQTHIHLIKIGKVMLEIPGVHSTCSVSLVSLALLLLRQFLAKRHLFTVPDHHLSAHQAGL